jgi:hypothetical protein
MLKIIFLFSIIINGQALAEEKPKKIVVQYGIDINSSKEKIIFSLFKYGLISADQALKLNKMDEEKFEPLEKKYSQDLENLENGTPSRVFTKDQVNQELKNLGL